MELESGIMVPGSWPVGSRVGTRQGTLLGPASNWGYQGMMEPVGRSHQNQASSLLPCTHKAVSRLCLTGTQRLYRSNFMCVWELIQNHHHKKKKKKKNDLLLTIPKLDEMWSLINILVQIQFKYKPEHWLCPQVCYVIHQFLSMLFTLLSEAPPRFCYLLDHWTRRRVALGLHRVCPFGWQRSFHELFSLSSSCEFTEPDYLMRVQAC